MKYISEIIIRLKFSWCNMKLEDLLYLKYEPRTFIHMYRVSQKQVRNMYRVSQKQVSNMFRVSQEQVSNMYKVSQKQVSNMYKVSQKQVAICTGCL